MDFTESAIQQSCIAWFRDNYYELSPVLIHPVNEGKRAVRWVRTKTGYKQICPSGARLKAEGMVPGTADLLLLVPRHGFGCLGIEMKSDTGRLRDNQKEWAASFQAAGNLYKVCRSLEDFISVVTEYLSD